MIVLTYSYECSILGCTAKAEESSKLGLHSALPNPCVPKGWLRVQQGIREEIMCSAHADKVLQAMHDAMYPQT